MRHFKPRRKQSQHQRGNRHRQEKKHTDLRLHQIVALAAYVLEEADNVDRLLVLDLLQHAVNDDVGACPTHSGTSKAKQRVRG